MANEDIKMSISEAGVYFYEIAELLGMNDGNFSRLLRSELSEEKKSEIQDIIESLAKGRTQKKATGAVPDFLSFDEGD
jgi:hypothetical protein